MLWHNRPLAFVMIRLFWPGLIFNSRMGYVTNTWVYYPKVNITGVKKFYGHCLRLEIESGLKRQTENLDKKWFLNF